MAFDHLSSRVVPGAKGCIIQVDDAFKIVASNRGISESVTEHLEPSDKVRKALKTRHG